jgi:hypothetical protein
MFSLLAIIVTVVLLASALLWRAVLNLPRVRVRLVKTLRGLWRSRAELH